MDDETAHGQPIRSLEALLQATDYSSLDELSGMADADLELDTVIRELGPEDGPGVEILVHGAGISLTYPFTIAEFLEAVQGLDEHEAERLAGEW